MGPCAFFGFFVGFSASLGLRGRFGAFLFVSRVLRGFWGLLFVAVGAFFAPLVGDLTSSGCKGVRVLASGLFGPSRVAEVNTAGHRPFEGKEAKWGKSLLFYPLVRVGGPVTYHLFPAAPNTRRFNAPELFYHIHPTKCVWRP